jgi:ribulose-phosphate 3-epimerase
MPRTRIAPSILNADFGRLAAEVQALAAGGADLIHVDVMDGHFVPNLTLGPLVVRAVRKATQVPLDVHLMIEAPERWISEYAEAGADIMTVHYECTPHLHRVLEAIHAVGKKAAVALNPATPIDGLRHVLELVDMVLVMSVDPGFGGQGFIPQVLEKITALRKQAAERGLELDIEVDGGIKLENVDQVVRAGANVIVSGTGILSQPDYRRAIQSMRQRADQAGLTSPSSVSMARVI